jgi:hypothetical protein
MRISAIAALLAAGCATAPPAEAGSGGRCDAAKAHKLIGRATVVTMDYREDRLNLRVNSGGRVISINCG